MSTRAEQEAEFEAWWNDPDRAGKPSPVLRALLRGEQHHRLDEHEAAFPADMGIAAPQPSERSGDGAAPADGER